MTEFIRTLSIARKMRLARLCVVLLVCGPAGSQPVVAKPRPALPPPPEANLNSWRFDGSNWWLAPFPHPLVLDNVVTVESWSGHALWRGGDKPSLLQYRSIEPTGRPNLNCASGSIRLWFAPAWSSASLGGKGPGVWGRLIEVGEWTKDGSGPWWSLYFNEDGSAVFFSAHSNGQGVDFLKAPIAWRSDEWHQIALTYSANGCALYLDGQLAVQAPYAGEFAPRLEPLDDVLPFLGEKAGVSEVQNNSARSITIGCDPLGENLPQGWLDEMTTFNYPLNAKQIADYFKYTGPLSKLGPISTPALPISIIQAVLPPPDAASLDSFVPSEGVKGIFDQTSPDSGGGSAMMSFGANDLWLEIALVNGAIRLILHNTAPDVGYEILSRTDPVNGGCRSEQFLFGTTGQDWTQTTLPLTGSQTVFFTAGISADTDGDGLSDSVEHFVTGTDPNNPDTGNTGVSDGYKDADGDGWTNLDEFRNGSNPNGWNPPAAPHGVRVTRNANNTVTITWEPVPGPVIEYVIQSYRQPNWPLGSPLTQEIGRVPSSGVLSFTDSAPWEYETESIPSLLTMSRRSLARSLAREFHNGVKVTPRPIPSCRFQGPWCAALVVRSYSSYLLCLWRLIPSKGFGLSGAMMK